jgi:signal transduction histidine kinase
MMAKGSEVKSRKTGLGTPPAHLRMFRTTAFKLSLVYLAVFTVFAGFLILYIAYNTAHLVSAQTREAVDLELKVLADQYRVGGIGRLTRIIERRSRRPGASLYLVTNSTGERIVGNVDALPASVLSNPDTKMRPIPYSRLGDGDEPGEHFALARVFQLSGGYTVLVGRDMGERERFISIIQRSLMLTAGLMVVLGLASWLFVSRRVMKRIDSVADTSRQIMAGDLSGRIEVTGTGDEFDRLAISLNGMLVRIERLMTGLKEVSDNIAHDLKTPLTRMRNRAETALAQAGNDAEYRDALQETIEDSDQLIRTFNALLMIARVEAGSSTAELAAVDAVELVRDVCELYEPLADDAGIGFSLDATGSVTIRANRELLSQALANMLDNAIKYCGEQDGGGQIDVAIAAADGMVTISVADNGPGISEADRERVTERFVRLEASRSKPGAGLGLSLVTAVADLHDGRFELDDNAPGLKASLILPANGGADGAGRTV